MKTQIYTLPAHWASYLVNGDASGLDIDDKQACGAWLDKHPELGLCLHCSDDATFEATGNDANSLGGDCLEFTFPVANPPTIAMNITHPANVSVRYECHTIHKIAELDTYSEGCAGAGMHSTIAYKIVSDSLASIKQQICDFLGCDEEALTIDACEEVGRIDAGLHENAEGYTASVSEMAAWQAGECELYYANYLFYFEQVARAPAVFPMDAV